MPTTTSPASLGVLRSSLIKPKVNKKNGTRAQRLEGDAMARVVAGGMAAYLGELWGLDVHVGRLIDALDALGHANNTLLLFASDHGPEQAHEPRPAGKPREEQAEVAAERQAGGVDDHTEHHAVQQHRQPHHRAG